MRVHDTAYCHCVIGPGRLGTALIAALSAARARVLAIGLAPGVTPAATARPPRASVAEAVRLSLSHDVPLVIWLTVPDDAIAGVADEVGAALGTGPRPETAVVHTSGLAPLDILAPAAAGARVLSLHPLQTFAPGQTEVTLSAVPIAVTARDQDTQALGERLATTLGGRPFALADEAKPLYHLAAVFASNLLVALQAEAAGLLREATGGGIDGAIARLRPLTTTTLANLHAAGPSHALTGPVARGDVGTVRAHLELLDTRAPRCADAYRALSMGALALAAPRLDDETVRALHDLLCEPKGQDSP